MSYEIPSSHALEVRPIVSIVLRELTRLRTRGGLQQGEFEAQVERLRAEELRPRGQSVLVRELRDGQTRFIIKDRDGGVCELIDCPHCSGETSASEASSELPK